MAIFSKIFIAASAFAALSTARPLAIRDVTSIVTETSYTTIDVPVTLWVDENGKPLSTVVEGGNFVAQPTPEAKVSKVIESSASPSSFQAQVQVVQTSTPAPLAQVVPTTSSASHAQVVPTTTPAPQAPAYTPAPAPIPSPDPSTAIPAPAPTNNAQSGQATGDVVASSSATCEGTGNACEGDITHWDGGLGACGWNVNSDSDMQVSLPVGLMGSLSNSNPYCGRSLTIKNPQTGATVQATVGDKCMGCEGRSIDLTNALFAAVGNGCDGRCPGFQWWFN